MSQAQLVLNYESGYADSFGSCREFIASRVHQLGKPQKAVAAVWITRPRNCAAAANAATSSCITVARDSCASHSL